VTTWPRPPSLSTASEARPDLEVLDETSCWSLLGEAPVGRIAVTTPDGTVLVLPVNFVVEGRAVIFRTAPGAALDHIGDRSVTFQADGVDPWHHTGWSVLAHGPATVEEAPADDDTAPEPWAGRHRRTLVRIHVKRITGRVLRPAVQEWDTRGYL
jgi:hypothetical protein